MTDIAELVKRLRDRDAPDGTVGWAHATYPPQKVKDALCNQAADALEAQTKEIKIYQQTELTYVTRVADAQREYSEMQAKLKARIAELETALKPLEKAWLFPDDLGEEASSIIRCDPDWNEEENDKTREDVIVCRQEIRKARVALNGEKG